MAASDFPWCMQETRGPHWNPERARKRKGTTCTVLVQTNSRRGAPSLIGEHQERRRGGLSPSRLQVDAPTPVSTEDVPAYVVGVPSLLTEGRGAGPFEG